MFHGIQLMPKQVGSVAAVPAKVNAASPPNAKPKVVKSAGSASSTGIKKPKAVKSSSGSSKKAGDGKSKKKSKISVTPPPINGRSAIIITESGCIKRISMLEFKTQSRGGKGKLGVRLGGDVDFVNHFVACNDYDTLLFSTEKGIVFSAKAYYVPVCSRASKGRSIHQLLKMEAGTVVTSVLAVDSFDNEEESILFLTNNGFIKKTPLKAFENVTGHGLIAMGLNDGDSLKWARICQPSQDIIIATKDGFVSRFPVKELASTSRKSKGVKSMTLRVGDRLVDMSTITGKDDGDADSYLLAVTECGYGKRILSSEISVTRRGCRGLILTKFKKTTAPKRSKKPKQDPSASAATSSSSAAEDMEGTSSGAGEGAEGDDVEEEEGDAMKDEEDMIIFQGDALDGTGEDAAAIAAIAAVTTESGKSQGEELLHDSLRSVRYCTLGDEVVLVTGRGTVMRQRVDDISVQSRNATGVLLQSTAKTDAIKLIDVVAPSSELDSVPVDLNILATVVAGH